MEYNREKEMEEVAKKVLDLVNDFGFDPKEFAYHIICSHRTLQQSVFQLFLACIKAWKEERELENYDLRNEYTVKKSTEIYNLLEGIIGVPMI